MNTEILDLYDAYVDAKLDRRTFFEKLSIYAGGTAAALALLPTLEGRPAQAQAQTSGQSGPAMSLGKPYGPSSAYGPYEYSAIIDRPKLSWPNGKRLAVWVAPNIEFHHLNILKVNGQPPEIFAWSRYDYGNRVAVFRMMDVLGARNIRATVCLNSDICIYHPRIIEEGEKLNWEWMGHGESQSKLIAPLARAEQNAAIARCLATIEKATGRRPTGWMGTGGQENWDSPELFAANGITYLGDWLSDDQPFYMNVGNPRLVSIPYTADLNDQSTINSRSWTIQAFEDMVRRQFDVLYAESEKTAKVMCIALHPFLIGVPHRIGALGPLLDYIGRHDGVWWATGNEIAEAYRAQVKA